MKALTKTLTGAAVAAAVTITAAAPAQAQYRYRDRDRGIDAGDVIAGVAIIGGIAAIASAIGNGNNRDRYDDRRYGTYGYGSQGYGEGAAVDACRYQAARYGRGDVRITDVDRRNNRSYRIRGVIDNYDGGYDRGYGNRGYGYDRSGYDRIGFECDARDDGRITDFDTERYR